MKIKTVFLWSVLVLLIFVTGCFEQPIPMVYIESSCTAETLYGKISFRISVFTAKSTTIQKVDIFIDDEFFARDEVPLESHYDTGLRQKWYLFPDHYWDSTAYADGYHVINAVVYTSNGEMTGEKLFVVSHYMIDAEATIRGLSGNSAKATVDFYNGATKSKPADGLVDIYGFQMDWDDTQQCYRILDFPLLHPVFAGETLNMDFSFPGADVIYKYYFMIEPFVDFHAETDIDSWINGEVNNLHLVWRKNGYSEKTETQIEIVCYDAMMNELACNAKEIPQLTYETECYLSRAIIPDNLKYIKINLKSIYSQENGQYCNDPDPAVIYETKIIQYSTLVKNF